MKLRLSIMIGLALVFVALAVTSARGQSTAAFAQTGTVVDAMGQPVVGALVAAARGGAVVASARTDVSGLFALQLEAGRYAITIGSPGFNDATKHVTTASADGRLGEFVLHVAGVHETVTVTAPAGDTANIISTATKTATPARDVPQSITIVTQQLVRDQLMTSIGDVVRYVPGITAHQGENNRDDLVIRGNRSSADFFVNGVRDDVQYFRDLYNLERIEALKGPNAMIFGRGGGGGVVNRVTKEPHFRGFRELMIQAGMFGNRRMTADIDEALSPSVGIRLNGMFENSDSFRHNVGLERYGVTPAVTFAPGARTKITLRYEYLHDGRVADRGITSFQGHPADVDIATFYGDPSRSRVALTVNLGAAVVEHRIGRAVIRNHTLFGDYDRFYQNFVPGSATTDGARVSLSAYNNASKRRNLFNQTDVTLTASTGAVKHTFLAGAETGRQLTDNFRNTGFFNNAATSILVPFSEPLVVAPVTFRQSGTDADNRVRALVAAAYAQDVVELSDRVHVIGGLRFDRFDLLYRNNRTGERLSRPDNLVSPRTGLVYKPIAPVSLYGSYSVSYLPSAGDQFSSLTSVTQQLKPEKFNNYETGAKWDVTRDLSVTAALYRLDRANTRSTDPNDPTRIIQTGSQRTNGFELGVNGRITPAWTMTGGYAYQHAFVTSATAAARAGAEVGQVPRHTLSLWNSYQINRRVTGSVGFIQRSDMFAAIDDMVTLPAYVRVDAAGYVSLTHRLRLQANVENLLDERYYVNADSNTNISPGFPRTLRVAIVAGF